MCFALNPHETTLSFIKNVINLTLHKVGLILRKK